MKQQRLVLDKKHTLVNNKDQDNNQNYLPFTQIGYRDVFTHVSVCLLVGWLKYNVDIHPFKDAEVYQQESQSGSTF